MNRVPLFNSVVKTEKSYTILNLLKGDDHGIVEDFYKKHIFNSPIEKPLLKLPGCNFVALSHYLPFPKMETVQCIIASFSLLNEREDFSGIKEMIKDLKQSAPSLKNINLYNEVWLKANSQITFVNVVKNLKKRHLALVAAFESDLGIIVPARCRIEVIVYLDNVSKYKFYC